MKKYIDKEASRLIFLKESADCQYWDTHWMKSSDVQFTRDLMSRDKLVLSQTKRYLPKGARILEGGCGNGHNVNALQFAGYDVYGIDFASETVKRINKTVPTLKVSVGDVRALEFPDSFFDGYWSLGVIEHFPNGYDDIAAEMYRVLRRDGYLFLTVPSMSVLRTVKAKAGLYAPLDEAHKIEKQFYQFALSRESVIERFNAIGFKYITHKHKSGIKGLKDELQCLSRPLQWVYNGRSPTTHALRKIIEHGLRPLTNHMSFFVFEKR